MIEISFDKNIYDDLIKELFGTKFTTLNHGENNDELDEEDEINPKTQHSKTDTCEADYEKMDFDQISLS